MYAHDSRHAHRYGRLVVLPCHCLQIVGRVQKLKQVDRLWPARLPGLKKRIATRLCWARSLKSDISEASMGLQTGLRDVRAATDPADDV